MSESRFDPNDPRLTAYVLGELDAAEQAEVELLLESCEESRKAVAEIRQLSSLLSEQFRSEPAPALTPRQRAVVEAEIDKALPQPARRGHRWVVVTAVTTLAAAGLLVALSPDGPSSSPLSPRNWFREQDDLDGALVLNDRTEAERLEEAEVRSRLGQIEEGRSDAYGRDATPIQAKSETAANESLESLTVEEPQIRSGRAMFEQQKSPSPAASGFAAGGIPASTNQSSPVAGEQTRQNQSRYYSSGLQPTDAIGPKQTDSRRLNKAVTDNPVNRPASSSLVDEAKRLPARFRRNPQPQGQATPPSATPNLQTKRELNQAELEKLSELRSKAGSAEGFSIIQRNVSGLSRFYFRSGDDKYDPAQEPGILTSPLPPRIVGTWNGEKALEVQTQRLAATEEGKKLDQFLTEFLAEQENNEAYAPIVENQFLSPLREPLATFGIDVDTAAYSNVRRFLQQGRLPPPHAVRIEELVNYFHYDEPLPAGGDPFSVSLEAADCPWNPAHRLVRIGIKGKEIDRSERPHSNLVFLIDVSGSMRDANKLPLVKQALEMLVGEMTENDRIAIVTYAGEASLALDSTSGQNKQAILAAIRGLNANGSTNGEAGIKLAYNKAYEHRIADGSNRVILCTDGDFNVGVSDDNELMQMVHKYANQSKVFLSIFGFGMGNLKDAKLEKLADKGNGHYGYVDNDEEARKVFVEEMTGTLYTIAKDLKLQIEFNPYQVGAYRLIGYENRLLAAQDFDDDRKDAGDVGAGHSVSALFEIIPVDKLRRPVELKYRAGRQLALEEAAESIAKRKDPHSELLTVFLRYKQPDADESVKREYPLAAFAGDAAGSTPSKNMQWASSVAAFGMVLRDSQYRGHANYDLIRELALPAVGEDESGRRKEFLELVKVAQQIHSRLPAATTAKPPTEPEPPDKEQQTSEGVTIGKDVQYWMIHKTNGNEAGKVIQVLNVLFPQLKVKPGSNPGEVNVLARKEHHARLADLIPRMTLD